MAWVEFPGKALFRFLLKRGSPVGSVSIDRLHDNPASFETRLSTLLRIRYVIDGIHNFSSS